MNTTIIGEAYLEKIAAGQLMVRQGGGNLLRNLFGRGSRAPAVPPAYQRPYSPDARIVGLGDMGKRILGYGAAGTGIAAGGYGLTKAMGSGGEDSPAASGEYAPAPTAAAGSVGGAATGKPPAVTPSGDNQNTPPSAEGFDWGQFMGSAAAPAAGAAALGLGGRMMTGRRDGESEEEYRRRKNMNMLLAGGAGAGLGLGANAMGFGLNDLMG